MYKCSIVGIEDIGECDLWIVFWGFIGNVLLSTLDGAMSNDGIGLFNL